MVLLGARGCISNWLEQNPGVRCQGSDECLQGVVEIGSGEGAEQDLNTTALNGLDSV